MWEDLIDFCLELHDSDNGNLLEITPEELSKDVFGIQYKEKQSNKPLPLLWKEGN